MGVPGFKILRAGEGTTFFLGGGGYTPEGNLNYSQFACLSLPYLELKMHLNT